MDFFNNYFFVSCLLIIMIAVSTICFLFIRKFNSQDIKLNNLTNIMSVVTNELNSIKQITDNLLSNNVAPQSQNNNLPVQTQQNNHSNKLIYVSDDDDSQVVECLSNGIKLISDDSESDCDDSESDCDDSESDCDDSESDCDDSESDCDDSESDCDDNESESDNDDENNDSERENDEIEINNIKNIKIINNIVETNDEISDDEINIDIKSDEGTIENEILTNNLEIGKVIELTEENTDDNQEIKNMDIFDYKKLSVNKLRELIVQKGTVSDASKLKKNEIIELLEK
jgi:hypothetical protein